MVRNNRPTRPRQRPQKSLTQGPSNNMQLNQERAKYLQAMKYIASMQGESITKNQACAIDFARVLASPFDTSLKPPCIPDDNATDSLKFYQRQFFEMEVGASGVGFVAFRRQYANDVNGIFHSDSGYAGTTVSANTATAGVSGIPHKFPLNNAAFAGGNDYEHRVVSEAISLTPTDNALALGGTHFAVIEPNHRNLDGYGSAVIGSYPSVDISHPTQSRIPTSIQYVPKDEEDYAWSNTDTVGNSLLIGAIVIQGTAGAKYLVEVVVWHELVTRLMPGMSPSHSMPSVTAQIGSNHRSLTGTQISQHLHKARKSAAGAFNFIKTLLSGVNGAAQLIAAAAPKVIKGVAPIVKEALKITGTVAPLALTLI